MDENTKLLFERLGMKIIEVEDDDTVETLDAKLNARAKAEALSSAMQDAGLVVSVVMSIAAMAGNYSARDIFKFAGLCVEFMIEDAQMTILDWLLTGADKAVEQKVPVTDLFPAMIHTMLEEQEAVKAHRSTSKAAVLKNIKARISAQTLNEAVMAEYVASEKRLWCESQHPPGRGYYEEDAPGYDEAS